MLLYRAMQFDKGYALRMLAFLGIPFIKFIWKIRNIEETLCVIEIISEQ
jgi:hypothetical protein